MTHIKLSLTTNSDPNTDYAVIKFDNVAQKNYVIQLLPVIKAVLLEENNANNSVFINLSEVDTAQKLYILSIAKHTTSYKALGASQEVPSYPTTCPLVENVKKG